MAGSSLRTESLGFLLLSHHRRKNLSHTLEIRVAGRTLNLCARCSGMGIGFVLGLVFLESLLGVFSSLPILIAVFPIPAAVDWLLQVFRVRDSTNPRRVVTGVLIGVVYALAAAALFGGRIILLEYFGIVWVAYFCALYMVFRKTGALNRYISSVW